MILSTLYGSNRYNLSCRYAATQSDATITSVMIATTFFCRLHHQTDSIKNTHITAIERTVSTSTHSRKV